MNDLPTYDPLARNPATAAGAGPAEEPLPILEYLQLLWYRKWIIISITLLVAIAGWVWVNQQTPVYRAQSTMMIGSAPMGAASPEVMYLSYFNRIKVPDEIEIMKSRNLAEQVVRDLDLLSYPEFNPSLRPPAEPGLLDGFNPREWIPDSWKETIKAALDRPPTVDGQERSFENDIEQRQVVRAAGILRGGLDINASDLSSVITVGYRSPSPEIAALIANELPEVYMLSKLQAKYEATERATKWLSEQLADLRQEVEDAERAVEMYRAEHGLTDVGGTDLVTSQLAKLNSELIIARAERAQAEARLNQLRQLSLQTEADAELATRLLADGSSLVGQLRAQEVDAQRNISELSVEYGPKHPRMLQAQAELEQIQRRLDTEVGKIESSLVSDVEFARARERSLEVSVREAEAATGEQNREAIQLRALEREAAASRALFETFLEQFKETTAAEGLNEPGGQVLSKAQVPGAPFYPNVRKQTTTIALAGFVLAVLLVLGLEAINPGITNPEQAEKQLGLHTIGVIPLTDGKVEAQDQPLDKPQSGFVESLNSLRVALSLTDPDNEPRVVQVTSSIPEEGKTTLALALARLLVQNGNDVILVDSDLRRATIERRLGLPEKSAGLTDFVLDHDDDFVRFLVKDPKSDVRIMPSGSAEFAIATDIFSSGRMRHIVDVLRQNADYVIFDSPPVMAVADARLIGRFVDTTLFVARWNKTPVKVARAALKTLREGGTDIAGLVLQRVDLKRFSRIGYGDSGYYYHYGRYGQYYKT